MNISDIERNKILQDLGLEPEDSGQKKTSFDNEDSSRSDVHSAEEDLDVGQWIKEKGQAIAGGVVATGESMLHGLEWLGVETAGEMAKPLTELRETYLTPEHQSFANDIAQGFGSMIAFMVPGMTVARIPGLMLRGVSAATRAGVAATRAMEVAGIATSSGMEALSEAGSVYNELIEQGKSEEDASQGAFETFVYNAAVLGFTDKLSGFFKVGGKTLKEMGKAAASEGSQEALQSMMSQYQTTGSVDLKQAGYEGMIGSILGGGVAGVTSNIDRKVFKPSDSDGVSITDGGNLSRGMNAEIARENEDDAAIDRMIEKAVKNAESNIKEVDDDKARIAKQKKFEADQRDSEARVEESKIKEEKRKNDYIEEVSTIRGAKNAADNMLTEIRKTEDPELKDAAKHINKANELLYTGDLTKRNVLSTNYNLGQIIKNSNNSDLRTLSLSLQGHLNQKLADMTELEEHNELGAKEVDQYEKDVIADTKEREAEEKKKEAGTSTDTGKATPATTEKAKETTRVVPKSKPKTEVEDLVNTPLDKLTPTQRLQVRTNAFVRKNYSNKHNIDEEILKKGDTKEKGKRRFSKVENIEQGSVAATELNTELGNTVKFDGKIAEQGFNYYTTQKAIGPLKKGATFIVKEADMAKDPVNALKNKINKMVETWGGTEQDMIPVESAPKGKVRLSKKEKVVKAKPKKTTMAKLKTSKTQSTPKTFKDEVSDVIKPLAKKMTTRIGKVVITEKPNETVDGRTGEKTRAMMDNGDVYLYTDNITDLNEAVEVFIHETIGHIGLEKFSEKVGLNYSQLLTSIHDTIKTFPEYKSLEKLYTPEVKGMSEQEKTEYLTEEFLANRVEKLNVLKKRKIWTIFRDWINNWLMTVKTTGTPPQIQMKQVDALLRATSNFMLGENVRQSEEFLESTQTYIDKVKYVLKNNPKALTWYTNHNELVQKHFGIDSGIFNILLAVTSPGNSPIVNSLFAVRLYLHLQGKAPLPVSPKLGEEMLLTKLARLKSGKFYEEATKGSTFKVTQFVRSLLGDPNSVVLDQHIYRVLFGPSVLTNAFIDRYLEGKVEIRTKDAGISTKESVDARRELFKITDALHKEGIDITPSQVQAALWVRQIELDNIARGVERKGTTFDYEEGLNTKMDAIDGMTPLEYLHLKMGTDQSKLADTLRLGKIPKYSDLDIKFQEFVKSGKVRSIKETPALLNPEYFTNEEPKPMQENGKDMTLANFKKALKDRPYAIISAQNPPFQSLSNEENRKRNEQLAKKLQEMGVEYSPVQGNYNGKIEDSFIVFGISEAQAQKLGQDFLQDSVIINDKMIFNDGSFHSQKGEANFDSKQTENYSIVNIKNTPVKFSMDYDWDNKMMRIVNYSRTEGRTEVDPAFMGKGQMGAEKSEFKNRETGEMMPGFLKKSNWYVEGSGKSQEPHRFGHLNKNEAIINMNEIYTLEEHKPSDVEIQKMGFRGWYNPAYGQVRLFDKQKVTPSKKKTVQGKIRFSKVLTDADIHLEPTSISILDDQYWAQKGELADRTFINRLWEWVQSSIQAGQVEIGKLEENFYKALGLGDKWTKRTLKTDTTQAAVHLFLDTQSNPKRVDDYYTKIMGELETAKGAEKIRLQDHKAIIEEMRAMSNDVRMWALDEVRKAYDERFELAKEADIVDDAIEAYVRRLWKAPAGREDSWSVTGMNKPRTLGSIIEGWERGMDLKVQGVLPALEKYSAEVATKIAQKQFREYGMELKDLTGTPFFTSDEKIIKEKDYVKLDSYQFTHKGQPLYAPAAIAKQLNRMTATDNLFENVPMLKAIERFNAGAKGWILSVSFFHYIAGIRSWVFGVTHGTNTTWNPRKAAKEGRAKVERLAPVIKLGVKNGLTLGSVQDFDAQTLNESKGIIENLFTKAGSEVGVKISRTMKLQREKFTSHMFKKFFLGLKAEAFAIEYAAELKHAQKKGTDYDVDELAQKAATLVNADFGGLNLKRMGRNPTMQRLFRMFALAPDWTESNFRTVFGALGLNKFVEKATGDMNEVPGMGNTYRRFWRGAAIKMILATVMAQAIVYAVFGDDDDENFETFYGDQFSSIDQFKKMKWATVDITPVLEKFGIETDGKKGFSLAGHFLDPMKLMDPTRLIKGKISPVGRIGEQVMTASDWAERPFTGTKEFLKTGKTVAKSRFQDKAGFFSRLPSTTIKSLEGLTPIMLQQAAAYLREEEDGITALLRSGGMHITTIRPVKAAEKKVGTIKSEVYALQKDLKNAKDARDREGIKEAREAIREYKGYNRTLLLVKSLQKSLKTINGRIKLLERIEEKGELSEERKNRLEVLQDRKKRLMDKFLDRYERVT